MTSDLVDDTSPTLTSSGNNSNGNDSNDNNTIKNHNPNQWTAHTKKCHNPTTTTTTTTIGTTSSEPDHAKMNRQKAQDPDGDPNVNASLTDYKYSILCTMTLTLFTLSMVLSVILNVFILMSPSTYWFIILPYLGWAYIIDFKTPFKGGKSRGEWLRNWSYWKYVAAYFPAKLIDDSGQNGLDSNKNYIFVQHPHGFYCYGAFLNFATNATQFREKFPGIYLKLSTLGVAFFIPIWRDIQLSYGAIPVDYHSCKYFLSKCINPLLKKRFEDLKKSPVHSGNYQPISNGKTDAKLKYQYSKFAQTEVNPITKTIILAETNQRPIQKLQQDESGVDLSEVTPDDMNKPNNGFNTGKALMIVVGGADESKMIGPGTMDLVLNKRRGFIKIALETGSSLVPVITFGENDIYKQLDNSPGTRIRRFQDALQKYCGFTFPVVYGRFLWILPYRRPLVSVVGPPIPVSKVVSPSRDEINHLHELYVSSLMELWDKWKDVYSKDRVSELRIVC